MSKQSWKPGNLLYPVPAVLVTCQDKDGKDNVLTVAWAGTICSSPVMLSISVRKERYSHHMIKDTGEFVVNLTTKRLLRATDYCGVRSGRDEDKFESMHLTKGKAEKVKPPIIVESPVNLECKVKQIVELGSHDMFVAEVVNVQISDVYMDEKGSFHLNESELIAYSHGEYYSLGDKLGTFGWSVRKTTSSKKRKRKTATE